MVLCTFVRFPSGQPILRHHSCRQRPRSAILTTLKSSYFHPRFFSRVPLPLSPTDDTPQLPTDGTLTRDIPLDGYSDLQITMEALALVGAVAALIQLSEAGGWFVRGLFRFAKHAGAAGVEVQRFGHQVRSSANSIEVALITLNRYCATHPTSAVVVYISTNDVLTNINKGAELVLDHIESIIIQVYSMRSRSVFWTKMKWSFKKFSILELCPEIEMVKTSLTLLMIAVQIEASASSGPVTGAGSPAPEDDGLKNEM